MTTSSPTSTQGFSDYYNDNNFIGAGVDNQIINSSRCSILQGSSSFISGKYNCHAIGDYMGAGSLQLEDNTFNIGCFNGTYSWGPIFAKRGLSVTHDAMFGGEVRIGGSSNRHIQPSGFFPDNSWLDMENGYFKGGNDFGYVDFDAQMDLEDMTQRWAVRIHNGFIEEDSDTSSDLFITTDPSQTQKLSNLNVQGDVISFSSSDRNLKDNISLIKNPLDKVLSLDAVEFDWNSSQHAYRGHDLGLIAQQVEEVAPELVVTRSDGYKAIKYDKINSLIVGAVQEQQKKIEFLEKRLESLERRSSRS